jgi:hypothetical protein
MKQLEMSRDSFESKVILQPGKKIHTKLWWLCGTRLPTVGSPVERLLWAVEDSIADEVPS